MDIERGKDIKSPISTPSRYLYLNFWGLFLIALAVAIAAVPLYSISYYLIIPQVIIFFICMKGGVGILNSWEDKKRKYQILISRNTPELRPDTFKEFMQAACGRLLVKVVLCDLGKSEKYSELKKLKDPLVKRLAEGCATTETVIYYVAPDKLNARKADLTADEESKAEE